MMAAARRVGALACVRAACALLLGAAALVAGAPRGALAQGPGSVFVGLPLGERFPVTFVLPVRIAGFLAARRPLTTTVTISTSATGENVVYQSVAVGDSLDFVVYPRLPAPADLFVRTRVVDADGNELFNQLSGPRRTPPLLELKSPAGNLGVTIYTRFPRFVWQSAPAFPPFGPWVYELRVLEVSTGTEAIVARDLVDTTFTPVLPLEGNAPYRWTVIARLLGGSAADIAIAQSPSSFVIRTAEAPVATLLYQNFPNPFPTPDSPVTCIWFDLAERGRVSLTVHDLRGNLVRRIVPGPRISGELQPGAYGRRGEGIEAGCDERLSWDGTDDAGRRMPPGLYLLRFQGPGGVQTIKKILYQGS